MVNGQHTLWGICGRGLTIVLMLLVLVNSKILVANQCKASSGNSDPQMNVCKDEKKNFNLCYISLNNVKEYQVSKQFIDKLNKESGIDTRINVLEFQTPKSDPRESFQKMVESGTVCNGLVISGHHTGAFGGHNASNSLDLTFMEDLACKPEYANWFKNVSALWLQGCRTLGARIVSAEGAASFADFHAQRVSGVAAEDGLEQTQYRLNQEFSNLLDDANPYSSRFLRVFPRANIFGWTGTAPGERARSEWSIPYHISNMARLVARAEASDDQKPIFDDPTNTILSTMSLLNYQKALLNILDPHTEEKCLPCEAWKNHGNRNEGEGQFGFLNPDIEAFPALSVVGDAELMRARELECIIKEKTGDEQLAALKEILSSEKMIGLSFNSLIQLLSKGAHNKDLLALLNENPLLDNFIKKKLANPEISDVRKIDYYAFRKKLKAESDSKFEEKLVKSLHKAMAAAAEDFARRDFAEEYLDSLLRHDILSAREATRMLGKHATKNKEFAPIIARALSFHAEFFDDIKNKKIPISEQQELIEIFYKVPDARYLDLANWPGFPLFFADAMTDKKKALKVLGKFVKNEIHLSKEQREAVGETLKKILTDRELDERILAVAAQYLPAESLTQLIKDKVLVVDIRNQHDSLREVSGDRLANLPEGLAVEFTGLDEPRALIQISRNPFLLAKLDSASPNQIAHLTKQVDDIDIYDLSHIINYGPKELREEAVNKVINSATSYYELPEGIFSSERVSVSDKKKIFAKISKTMDDESLPNLLISLPEKLLSAAEIAKYTKERNADIQLFAKALEEKDVPRKIEYLKYHLPANEGLARRLLAHPDAGLYSKYLAGMSAINLKSAEAKQQIYSLLTRNFQDEQLVVGFSMTALGSMADDAIGDAELELLKGVPRRYRGFMVELLQKNPYLADQTKIDFINKFRQSLQTQ